MAVASRFSRCFSFIAVAFLAFLAAPTSAQTISGTVMDVNTDRPIELGLVLMFTEAGDSVGMTVTDEDGRFSLTAPEPGSFLLLASALGYKETPAGVFELGEDGVMDVEYRLAPEPLAIDELLVSLDRPVLQHKLVRNGFVRRLQRGLGYFITPHDIEESPATATEDLLLHVPNVRVSDVRITRPVATASSLTPEQIAVIEDQRKGGHGAAQYTIYPRPDIGQTVQIRSWNGGWCTPTVYVDGVRTFYTADNTSYAQALTLSTVAPLATMDAIEVYRRPAEIPVEFSASQSCGVLVLWTRSGLAPGQRPAGGEVYVRRAASDELGATLPEVREQGEPLAPGERIRMQIDPEVKERLGVSSPWQGTFITVRSGDLVAHDPTVGRAVAAPLDGIDVLQVERERAPIHAFKRGALGGVLLGAGMWQFLKILCRTGCDSGLGSAWFPASVTGLVVGVLVGAQGPGTHWVQAPMPTGDGPRR